MKNLFISALLISTLLSCSDATNESKTNTVEPEAIAPAHHSNSSAARTYAPGYQTQLAYITDDGVGITTFEVENDIQAKIEDPTISWTTFDAMYTSSLGSSVKQDLGYIILGQKNLIGIVNNDVSNTANVITLKKWVDRLITEKYYGYTLLNSALRAIKPVDGAYATSRAGMISTYAVNDTFHQNTISGGITPTGWLTQAKMNLIVDNYSKLSQIQALQ